MKAEQGVVFVSPEGMWLGYAADSKFHHHKLLAKAEIFTAEGARTVQKAFPLDIPIPAELHNTIHLLKQEN